ncbi:MAG: protein-export chaperone SecB [Rhodospirillaceae bacterium]|nr:MAG: protein-export chaperone SecB [Rhodospirillaceae bacterium]
MAENGSTPAQAAAAAQPQSGLAFLHQYLKDLSFENPNAAMGLMGQGKQPEVKIDVNVNNRNLSDGLYEVELHVSVKAAVEEQTAFIVECVYAGLVRIGAEVPEEAIERLLVVEVSRYLFPFAREIVSSATVKGGYPPLLLNPFNFLSLLNNPKDRGEGASSGPGGDSAGG